MFTLGVALFAVNHRVLTKLYTWLFGFSFYRLSSLPAAERRALVNTHHDVTI